MDPQLGADQDLATDIMNSIMTPGYTAKGVIKVMFYAFYALFATLFLMMIITHGNPHVITLFVLSICLYLAIRWFVAELDRLKSQNTTADAKPTEDDSGKTKQA
ncbi:hypothetical protein DM01DRAFT_1332910 [Hesseltinella vesiculosa]|uniref:Pkr1-domain-containing protein n=1 Tax=Hesseltinella vesiculosa TaxID=101127 RepID=A0A1X2GQV6_9FUNG|nr:hypothetical protein DM01DRAFT_1332910 [Hesseltinella vesiculosa]